MAKVKNIGILRKAVPASAPAPAPAQCCCSDKAAESEEKDQNVIPRHVQLSAELMNNVKAAAAKLQEIGFATLARDMGRLYRLAVNKRYTVAVVGEFSRGKSTLINRLLGRPLLPATNLPTTALLTRIVCGKQEKMTLVGPDGKKLRELPLKPESWEGLTAANFGEKEAEGSVVIECQDPWLCGYGIDLLDTPGAGDLEDSRVQLIERCMVGADAAIITIDATKPLSLTEQAFVRQKIMSRGVPFVALAVTKLDLVEESDRPKVLSYIINKLQTLKLTMPVVVADDDVVIPGVEELRQADGTPVVVGLEPFKQMVVAWMANKDRRALMEKWLTVNALAIINSARGLLMQQLEILKADDQEREELIKRRNLALAEMHTNWEELRRKMEERCKKCYDEFMRAAAEAGTNITEALQHEVNRQPNPKEWLDKEYAYRVKRELSTVSVALDNLVAKRVTNDMQWLNRELNQQFKEIVGSKVEMLMARDDFRSTVDEGALTLKNIKDQSVKATIVSSVLTLGSALMLGVAGGAPLILATMGVGTAANLISRKSLERESGRQREAIKELIAQQMPGVIRQASADSGTKIKILYNDIISESLATEMRWMEAQRALIRQSVNEKNAASRQEIDSRLESADALAALFA